MGLLGKLKGLFGSAQEKAGEAATAVMEKTDETIDSVKAKLDDLGVSEHADEAVDVVKDKAGDLGVTDKVEDAVTAVQSKANDLGVGEHVDQAVDAVKDALDMDEGAAEQIAEGAEQATETATASVAEGAMPPRTRPRGSRDQC